MPNAELKLFLKAKDEITKEIKKLRGEIKGVSEQTKKSNQEHSRSVRNLVSQYRSLALQITAVLVVIRQVTRVTGSMIDAASTVEQLNLRLKQTLGNVSEANQLFEDMKQLVSTAPVEFEEVFQAVAALSAVTKKGADEVRELIPIILDISATFGLSIQDVTTNMIRVMSAGIASADQFRERGVSVALGFKAGMTVSAEESIEFIKKQWRDGTNNIVGSIDNLRDTWVGRVGEMSDAWFFFSEEVGKRFIESSEVQQAQSQLIIFLQVITENLRKAREENKSLLQSFLELGGIAMTFSALNPFATMKSDAREFREQVESSITKLQELTEATRQMAQEAKEVKTVFDDLSETIDKNIEELEDISKNLTKVILKSVDVWANSVGNAFAEMILEGENFGKAMEKAFKKMAATFIAQVASMIAKWLAFLALRRIGRFFGVFHEGGVIGQETPQITSTFHKGGPIRAHDGLAVDEVPIIAQTGEGILSRRGMQNIGGTPALNALNSGGQASPGQNITITITNPNFRTKQDITDLVNQIGFQLDKELRYPRTV